MLLAKRGEVMKPRAKRLLKWIFILSILAGAGYLGYYAYEYAVDAVVMRIKRDIKDKVFGVINPLRWPKKFLGL